MQYAFRHHIRAFPGCGVRHQRFAQFVEQDIAILKNNVVTKYAHFTLAEMKSMEDLYVQNPGAECNEISKRILAAK